MSIEQRLPHDGANYRLDEAVVSMRNGVLRADDFDDMYFAARDGLAESRHVFIDGTNFAETLHRHKHLTIAETGFGSGLNFLAVLDVLQKFPDYQPDYQIDYIAFESRPLPADVIARTHAGFPSLAAHSIALLDNLPPRWPGLHLCHFNQGQVRLHLRYGEAEDCLAQSRFCADIWFLDGFAPAKNPDMWSDAVLAHIGRLTRAGGRLASFTAARMVRDGLSAAGFAINKKPGFGDKRDMITGVKTGVKPPIQTVPASPKRTAPEKKPPEKKPHVGIIGGGISGASVAAGLRHRRIAATILDAGPRLATAASGNRLALLSPRLSVDHNAASQLSACCLAYAAKCSDQAAASIAGKVVSLDWPEREASRQDKFRRQYWPDDLLRAGDASAATVAAGMAMPTGGVVHDYGRVIDPARLCHYLAGDTPTIFDSEITQMSRRDSALILDIKDGRQYAFDVIVLATGASLPDILTLLSIDGVRIDVTSGQVSHIPEQPGLADLQAGLSFGGYLTPSHNGFHELGATFDRSGCGDFDDAAFAHNRNLLPPALQRLFGHLDSAGGRISQRASAPDRNPVMGRLDDGIYLLGAVGARGFTLAPLLGEYLAAEIAAMPNCLSHHMQATLDPFRFRLRRGL
jgi:tRNA 5-methylaminomethyl-2-thiouridine biosynthesis bifunctional protein